MKYGEVSGVSYCRLSDPVNIPPNVHMLASTCFPHVFSRTLLSATSCGGFVLNISKLKLCKKKTPPTQIGSAFLLLLSALALLLHPFIFWFCICLSTYKHMYTRHPNLLLLICSCNMSTSHLLAPQPGCSANVHCQAGTGSSWQMRPVSTLSADGLKFCVSILFSCAWWTHRVGHRVCVPFVSTRQTPHVCLGSPPSPRV